MKGARGFFFDKVAGAPSMVRLVAFVLTLDATAVTVAVCVYALRAEKPDAAVLTAMVAALTALVGSGVVALFRRAAPSTPTPPTL